MSGKTSLFHLIKSLSAGEKRFFLQTATRNKSESNYLKLFSVIEKQEVYDEAVIKSTFKDKRFITQLHVTKINLTQLILKSLKNFHSQKSVNAKILELIREIEILYAKELYDLCLQRLDKALQLARTYERFPLHLELLQWKRKLVTATSTVYAQAVAEILHEESNLIGKVANLNTFWNESLRVFDSRPEDAGITEKDIYQIEKAGSTQAKILHHHFLFTRSYVVGKFEKANAEVSKLILLLEKNQAGIEDDPSSYITALMNKVVLLLSTKQWHELPPALSKVRSIINSSRLQTESQMTVRLWVRLFNVELEMYRDTQDTENGTRLIGVIQAYLQARKAFISPDYLILFFFQFASIHFAAKDFPKSLKWINEIINTNFGSTRLDIQKYARILNMMVHFELNNISLLKYNAEACKRFIRKKKILFAAEEILLQLFLKIHLLTAREYSAMFTSTLAKWQVLDEAKRTQIDDYLDISGWLKKGHMPK